MNMTSLPIKKGIEGLLQSVRSNIGIHCYTGVWLVEGKNKYIKSTSELKFGPVNIPIKCDLSYKKAYEVAIRCAKVYKAFIKEGIYHPDTDIVLYKDDKENFALMILMPKLNTKDHRVSTEKLSKLRNKFNLSLSGDMFLYFNWGIDEKGDSYAHDMHLGEDYTQILEIADKMGIK